MEIVKQIFSQEELDALPGDESNRDYKIHSNRTYSMSAGYQYAVAEKIRDYLKATEKGPKNPKTGRPMWNLDTEGKPDPWRAGDYLLGTMKKRDRITGLLCLVLPCGESSVGLAMKQSARNHFCPGKVRHPKCFFDKLYAGGETGEYVKATERSY